MGYDTPAALYKMVPVEEALEKVLSEVRSTKASFQCGISQCVGHVLDQDVVAPAAIPDKALSIMDGFAVQAGDDTKEFAVVGENRAGNVDDDLVVSKGGCCYITTGSPLPRGSDAVVMIEDTKTSTAADGKRVMEVLGDAVKNMAVGHNVRQIGSDMALGEVVLGKGKLLESADIGILASLGFQSVAVVSKPLAAFMSTGDEVVDVGTGREASRKGRHQIYDANRPVLLSCAQPYCSEVMDLGITGDDQARLELSFQKAVDNNVDVLVTSGGVSMGDSDLIKPILEQKGKVHFGKVMMKPGKPLTFATVEGREKGRKLLVFGLPGNPVSSFVTFNLVVVPALRKLAGWTNPRLRRMGVRTADKIAMDPKRPEYHRVTLSLPPLDPFSYGCKDEDNGNKCSEPLVLVAHSTGFQRSSRLLSLRSANGLVEVPQGSGHIPAGATVSCLLIKGGDFF
ncbi:molybdopterin biosynthesis protein [Chloropicon primus]|uniref:Molybdopterin biosynthesis protein CNX1 n=1 Tax=Chloropicon primus TaxID=1764295 RepID=A0A5B8MZQ1_9CHLO|nr:molybdopterin biosynthesis protein [Chloropicon primus]UPR04986.1 molybdopterin biosynthesis protein [Chloropicon primus]|eukprot:QDZ25791.1 molybdopterin biosynthesis protein [Chloropicon primus]